jgi:hypothetical protein
MKLFLKSTISGLLVIGLAFSLWAGAAALAQCSATRSAPLSKDQARAIAVDAYVYFYPLVLIDLTRKQSTNIEMKEFGKGPMNTFVSVPAYPPADFKGVVRSNFDTLYSLAWLDLTKEPLVVSAPDTDGRFYLLPMLDMWTDVFASPGWRTTGTEAGDFLVTPPGWSGQVPEGFTRIAAPTPYVWIIGRTKTDGPADYDAVHKIQAGYKITRLSRWGKAPEPVTVKSDPTVDMKTPPMVQANTMPTGTYFAYAAELLKLQPPHLTDGPILAQMKRIGIEPGKSFDISRGCECAESLYREQLDAVQVQRGRLARSLFSERKSGQGQGIQLASRAEGAVQSDHATLLAAARSADGQVESTSREEVEAGLTARSPNHRLENTLTALGPEVEAGCRVLYLILRNRMYS